MKEQIEAKKVAYEEARRKEKEDEEKLERRLREQQERMRVEYEEDDRKRRIKEEEVDHISEKICSNGKLINDIFFDRSDASRRRMPSVKPKSREKWRRRGGRSRRRRDRRRWRGRLSRS